ncbi:hypothetical protein THUN1379_23470 [Paludibacterium sp. THUN1379]|nr:hypothetical protein THUN1379_23470 [Paludibacterium sp. THUN1379]
MQPAADRAGGQSATQGVDVIVKLEIVTDGVLLPQRLHGAAADLHLIGKGHGGLGNVAEIRQIGVGTSGRQQQAQGKGSEQELFLHAAMIFRITTIMHANRLEDIACIQMPSEAGRQLLAIGQFVPADRLGAVE